jgi:hypothetical protein
VILPLRAAFIGWTYVGLLKGDYGKLWPTMWLCPEVFLLLGSDYSALMWVVTVGLLSITSYILAIMLAPWFDKSLE